MQFKTMQRKKNLASAFGIQKRQLGVTMHFSEIVKLPVGKKKAPHTLLCILLLFRTIYCCLIISEKCMVTPNFPFGFQ